tara:strand:+ start:27 stop:545 length:519 start_codon:yes stop_codon:yes gene_type:complete
MSQRRPKKPFEYLALAFGRIGADALAVKLQRGLTLFAGAGLSATWESTFGGEAVPGRTRATVGAPYAGDRVAAADRLARFGAAQLYLRFQDGGGDLANGHAAKANVTAWRILDSGEVVEGPTWSDVTNRVLVRDDDVSGRATLYQVHTVVGGGATKVFVHVAGEGLGLDLEL